jgi:hypothetical protein
MDDLLNRHAEVVSAANAEHKDALRDMRVRADKAIGERIAAFGRTMIDLVKAAEDARTAFSEDLDGILKTIGEDADEAFAQNVATISLSAAEFQSGLEARTAFLRTGALPADKPADPPPNETAPPEERAAA